MKALFFDVDGTLIDGTNGIRAISPATLGQLERLHAEGHKLAVCSGRPFGLIGHELRLPVFDAYVMCNGAHVEVDGASLFEERMDPQLVRSYVGLFEELGVEYMLQTAHHLYLDPRFTTLRSFFEGFGHQGVFTFDFNKDEVVTRVIKLEAHATPQTLGRLEEAVRGKAEFTARMDNNGGYNAFEVFSPTISKAVGIQKVLDHFGVAHCDSLAFGDGINDLEMIGTVGTGVAMGNACEELKAVADVVCGSVAEDGLAHYLASVA